MLLFSPWKRKKYPIRIQNGKCSLIFPKESFSIPLPLQLCPSLRFFRHSADLGPQMLIFCPWRGHTVDTPSLPSLSRLCFHAVETECSPLGFEVLLLYANCRFAMYIAHTNKCLLFSRNLFPLLCRAGGNLLGAAVRCLVKWVEETPARWPGFGRSWLTDPMVVQTCPLISSGLYAQGSLEVVEQPVVPAQRLG